jgi:two-component system chemotaxis response regulator CheB
VSVRDVVVMGASAGGIEALRDVASRLPPGLEAAIFVVLHLSQGSRSSLPEIIARAGPLPAAHARDGERILHGRIYVAPPDHHLLLDDGRVVLSRGPHHNRYRPAVDPLFSSAARSYGPRVIGVVLSGALDDGTAGLARIKRRGGLALVQDPATATYTGMPDSALANVAVDLCVTPTELGDAIARAVGEPLPAVGLPAEARLDQEFEGSIGVRTDMEQIGKPSAYACPECHGVLWEFDEEGILQFRCRVGHSYSSEGLLDEHDGSLEAALWASVRALEENVSLRRRLAQRMRSANRDQFAERYEAKAAESERHAAVLRELLSTSGPAAGQAEGRA